MKLLYAEDEPLLSEAVADVLTYHKYLVDAVYNGQDAYDYALSGEYDGIILDIMLPGEDGISVLKALRSRPATAELPVIMATAKGTEYDKVIGLDLGADDYLAKPFGMMEMVSRVRAVLRRSARRAPEQVLRLGGVELDKGACLVRTEGRRIELTRKEYQLLLLFLENPGRVFTRDQLLELVWGLGYTGETRTVDVHIGTLRTKLGQWGRLIATVRGMGYRLEDAL